MPTLVMAPNKTLAAQLYSEFKGLFPENAVEYFVSYYDYYQPEAYIASSDTYIEKDSSINDEIDKLRHSARVLLGDITSVGRLMASTAQATVKVFPLPVTPRSVWCGSPRRIPSTSSRTSSRRVTSRARSGSSQCHRRSVDRSGLRDAGGDHRDLVGHDPGAAWRPG